MSRSDLPLPLPLEAMLTLLKRAAHFLLRAGIGPGPLVYLLAEVLVALRLRRLAVPLHDLSLYLADRSSSRRSFLVRQEWEYAAQRNRYLLGAPGHDDPMFRVEAVARDRAVAPVSRSRAAGYYEVLVTHRGLRIDGFLRPGAAGHKIEVLVDGVCVRRTTASPVLPGIRLFVVSLQRNALAALPRDACLTIRSDDGVSLLHHGCVETRLKVPHGDGNQPARVDKKGFLVNSMTDVEALHRGFLRIYLAAQRFFDSELGTPLFVLYGTLLGAHRGGDFIPGDDDFDAGYWSERSHSRDVLAEGMEFVVRLVKAGFTVTVNRSGRLFRLRLPDMPPACHLDIHAVWSERGSVWIHPRANLDCTRSDFLPVSTTRLGETEVGAPADPEAFLAAYYGADWRVPDPTYSTAARVFPAWKTRLLRRSCLTPRQVQYLRQRLASGEPERQGMFIAIGTESIYPLERYERLCGW